MNIIYPHFNIYYTTKNIYIKLFASSRLIFDERTYY